MATKLYYKGVKPGLITVKKAAEIMGHTEQMFLEVYGHKIDESAEATNVLKSIFDESDNLIDHDLP